MNNLDNAAIDRLIAERVMRWHKHRWAGEHLQACKLCGSVMNQSWAERFEWCEHNSTEWHPSTDHNDCAAMRAEIERRGLIDAFIRALSPTNNPPWKDEPTPKCNPSNVIDWCLVNAPTRLQCLAALKALEGRKGE